MIEQPGAVLRRVADQQVLGEGIVGIAREDLLQLRARHFDAIAGAIPVEGDGAVGHGGGFLHARISGDGRAEICVIARQGAIAGTEDRAVGIHGVQVNGAARSLGARAAATIRRIAGQRGIGEFDRAIQADGDAAAVGSLVVADQRVVDRKAQCRKLHFGIDAAAVVSTGAVAGDHHAIKRCASCGG